MINDDQSSETRLANGRAPRDNGKVSFNGDETVEEDLIIEESETHSSEHTHGSAYTDQLNASSDDGMETVSAIRDEDVFVPSTKVEHDFVPDAATSVPDTFDASPRRAELKPCPECRTELERWQLNCHNCGCVISQKEVPKVAEHQRGAAKDVQQSFSDWFQKGISAYEAGNFSEAQNELNEALTRVKGLPDSTTREAEVRKYLARALQKLDKKTEAAEQYMILSKLLGSAANKDYEQRARDLASSAVDVLSKVGAGSVYRVPTRKEAKLVPLYCAGCKQLLAEAEVFGFRNKKIDTVRCFCGNEGTPMARYDSKHLRALKDEPTLRMVRAQLLDTAASEELNTGRKRGTAILLAALFGWCGAHRFYLGETYYGTVYAFWFAVSWIMILLHRQAGFDWIVSGLSLVPWVLSIIEAIHLARMSRVNFNLTYNIENIISKLPEEEQLPEHNEELFSESNMNDLAEDDGYDDHLSGVHWRTLSPNTVQLHTDNSDGA